MKSDLNKSDESNASKGERKQDRCGLYSLNIANQAHLMSMSIPPRGQPRDAMFCLQYGMENNQKVGVPHYPRISKPNECKRAKSFKCCNPTCPMGCAGQQSKRFSGDKQNKNKTKDDSTQTNITCNPNQCAIDKLFEPALPKEESVEDEEEEANEELLSSKTHKSESFTSPNLSGNDSLILKDQTGEKLLSVTNLLTPNVEDQKKERKNPQPADSLAREEDRDLTSEPNSIIEQNVLDIQHLDSDAIKSEMHEKHKNRESNEKKSLEEDLLNENIDVISKDRRRSSRTEKNRTVVKTDNPILQQNEAAETLVKTEENPQTERPEETTNQKHMHKETSEKLIKEESSIGKDLKEYEKEYKEIDEDNTKSIKKLKHIDDSQKSHSDEFDNVSSHFDASKSNAQTTELNDSEMGVDIFVNDEEDAEKETHAENGKKAPSYNKTRNQEKVKKYPQGPTKQTENSNAVYQHTHPLYPSFSGACGCRFSCPNAYSRMIMYGYQPGACAGQTWCPYCRCCCRFCKQNLRH